MPFPDRIQYPGAGQTKEQEVAKSWQTVTFDEMVSPEVVQLLKGA